MPALLSDCNEELINCYQSVRSSPAQLIAALNKHRNDKHHFYKVRQIDPESLSNVDRAARLIYLNKTCFNGLYRVNRKGQFNVPFGKYKNPKICDTVNLRAASTVLATAKLRCASFEIALKDAYKDDFVYLDPPYQPLSATAYFTSYTKGSFAIEDQKLLAKTCRTLSDRGCLFMLSNSDTVEIRELYRGFRIERVFAPRAINCRSDRRGPVAELLVMNY